MLGKIKKYIDSHKIISFDIFDTLLVRPYFKPTDMFWHIEKIYQLSGFALSRINAEQNARFHTTHKEDITIDEIYAEMDERFQFVKQLEIEFEHQILRRNPELKEIYDYALNKNKIIVVASDMYLPTSFLQKVLNENGYNGFDRIYVSGDIDKTKTNGSMFKQILLDYKVKPEDVFHIGDNLRSDYKTPKKIGIKAFLYEQIIQQFVRCKHFETLLKSAGKNLGLSILLAMQAYNWKRTQYENNSSSYWYGLGYEYAGPSAYGYVRHIQKQAVALNIDKLLFVARDGWLLQKIYNTFEKTLPNGYVYAPRYINLIYRLGYNKKKIEQMRPIIDYYATENLEIKRDLLKETLVKAKDYHKFIQNHIKIIKPIADKAFASYSKYVKALAGNESGKIGIVDTVTGEFSSQRLLQSAIPNSVCGFYWSILNLPEQIIMENDCYITNNENCFSSSQIFTSNWNFMEFLITSPEYPVKNLQSGKPVYEDNPDYFEVLRSNCYKDIARGALDFCKEINGLFKGKDIYLSATDIIAYINCFLVNPSKNDFKNMKIIRFGLDSAHTDYVPLTAYACTRKELMHPLRALKLLKQARWLSGMQKFILAFTAPLNIKTRGLRVVKLSLFPYFSGQYLNFKLHPTKRILWQFIIGNYREE